MKKFIVMAAICLAPALSFADPAESNPNYPSQPGPETTSTPNQCMEGQREVFWEGSDTLYPVAYVCQNGVFVRAIKHKH